MFFFNIYFHHRMCFLVLGSPECEYCVRIFLHSVFDSGVENALCTRERLLSDSSVTSSPSSTLSSSELCGKVGSWPPKPESVRSCHGRPEVTDSAVFLFFRSRGEGEGLCQSIYPVRYGFKFPGEYSVHPSYLT